MCGRPTFYTGRGTVSLRVTEIRAVGIGELLARIERLRQLLAAEGLFDSRLKRPVPFLPRGIGLITGRASAAARDVVAVVQSRWPAVRFAVRNAPVQGPTAVPRILGELKTSTRIPMSTSSSSPAAAGRSRTCCRSPTRRCARGFACTTPVISAIGHEPDNPLLDLVADLRAATPTDAAKRVVPDVAAELAGIATMRRRSAGALRNWVQREQHIVDGLRARPALADPLRLIDAHADAVERHRADLRRDITRLVETEEHRHEHLAARLATLGPAQTLARGYAIVQNLDDGRVARSVADLPGGARLRVRLADGAVGAQVTEQEGMP